MIVKKNQLAVTLKYPEGAAAPLVTAKEDGRLAQRIIELAEEEGVPVVHNDVLAQILSVQKIGACIPQETWLAVAGIFAFIKKLEYGDDEKTVL